MTELLANVLAPAIAKQGIDFHLDISNELACRPMIGDAQRIGQVLVNLVGNAVKFTSQGAVRVSVRVEAELPAGPLVLFEIRDSGIGIASQDQKGLFRAFAQVDDKLSRHYEGTGLGLAICKHLVDLMGGTIGLQSVSGEGSTFWFALPLECSDENPRRAVEKNVAASAAIELATQFVDARILVAVDNPVHHEMMGALLRLIGMRVDVVSDGVQAVSMAVETDYDLIFMDLQMPRLNGIEAVRTIRLDPRRRNTPIVALTASVPDQDHQDCMDAGMNDLLAKPIGRDVLYGMVLKWLRLGQSRTGLASGAE